MRQTTVPRLEGTAALAHRRPSTEYHPPPILPAHTHTSLSYSPSPTSIYLVCQHRSYRLVSPRLVTSTDTEPVSRHRSLRVPSFVIKKTRGPGRRTPEFEGKLGICAVGAEQEQGQAARNIRPMASQTRLAQRWGIKGKTRRRLTSPCAWRIRIKSGVS